MSSSIIASVGLGAPLLMAFLTSLKKTRLRSRFIRSPCYTVRYLIKMIKQNGEIPLEGELNVDFINAYLEDLKEYVIHEN